MKRFKYFSACFILMTMLFSNVSYAYENSNYYKKIRIGLKSMICTYMKLKFNGNYVANGTSFSSGTSIDINITNNKISINGVQYDNIRFIPDNIKNAITVTSIYSSENVSKTCSGIIEIDAINNYIWAINELNIEDYLEGVVGHEMLPSYPMEALKSQAVAARTYALNNHGKYGQYGFDLSDMTDCQVYYGIDSNQSSNVINSVLQTQGQVLLHNDSLIDAVYSASNGGFEESSENVWGSSFPYLVSQKDDFDGALFDDGYKWTSTITNADINKILHLQQNESLASDQSFDSIDINSIEFYTGGMVKSITINYINCDGSSQKKILQHDSVRTFLNLKSAMYTVTYDIPSQTYTFKGSGIGHGVGMSQTGALYRAKNSNNDYKQILSFYYPTTVIASLYRPLQINSVTIDKSIVIINNDINITTNSSYGSGECQYKYVVKNNGQVVDTYDYSSNSTLRYNVKNEGNYSVDVYVKDVKSTQEYDDVKSLNFISKKPVINGVTISPSKIYINDTVNISASSSNGSGQGINYMFEIYKNGQRVQYQSFSSKNTFQYVPVDDGAYNVAVYIKDVTSNNVDNSTWTSFQVNKDTIFRDGQVKQERISGYDRYQTAIEISKYGWASGSNNVIIATGEDFPDALCAGPLAKILNAPILLTYKSTIETRVIDEIKRLSGKNIYIIGSEGAVSSSVEYLLRCNGFNNITRISGKDRYETSEKVAETIYKIKGSVSQVAIVTGQNYPDAVSVIPFAAYNDMPILLSYSTSLGSSTSNFINHYGIRKTFIIGSNQIINSDVQGQLPNPERLYGSDRYQTNYSVINRFYSSNIHNVYVVTGDNFPDAIAISALAAKNGEPIILSNKYIYTPTRFKIIEYKSYLRSIRFIGSDQIVPNDMI